MKKLLKNKKMIIFLFIFFVSCSSIGVQTVPDEDVLPKNAIINYGIAEVTKKYGDIIDFENVGIYKKGYKDWKLVMYGEKNFYTLTMTEDGKVVSIKQGNYDKNITVKSNK